MSTAFRLLLCVFITAPMSGLLARDLQIGVYGSPPFVITEDSSLNPRLQGVSIELWQEIARRRQFQYRFHTVASIPEGIEQLRAGQLDVLVGSLSVTRERTTRVDFTHPYYSAFQGILSRKAGYSPLRLARKFLSGGLPIALGVLLLLLFLVGSVIWKLERDINPHMPGTFGRGVGTGMWFAMVTFVTVGYGDVTPRSPAGRIITGVWMLISMLIASSITAAMATAFTLQGLQSASIQSSRDLSGSTVASVAGTTGQQFAIEHGALVTPVTSVEAAFQHLRDGEVQAITYDYPILRYELQQHPEADMHLLQTREVEEDYAFALRPGNPLRREINLALLEILENGEMDRILNRAGLGSQ